jgi:hypothetical protein
MCVGAIPVGWFLYYISRSDDPNAPNIITRLIDEYTDSQEKNVIANDLHVQMMERAGSDRVLFRNSNPSKTVPLKFPE